ncbi:MAG: hypothetical protein GX339_05455 [Tissierellia bacterium]|nr:hypothetical protein [Tissierellia bacterium]
MKRRRKNKGGSKFYMVLSIICLSVLFLGYSFVYNLSEERKSGQEVTTISINYNNRKDTTNSSTLDKIMSYFNLFLEKTFKEKENDTEIIENNESKSEEVFKTIESGNAVEKLEIFDDDEYTSPSTKKEVYLANDRKKNFFRVVTSSSRSSASRKLFVNTDAIGGGLNIVLFHTHGTEAFKENQDTNYRSLEESANIVGIGSQIAGELFGKGLKVIHLKDYNDYPDYNSSYANSNFAVRQVLSNTKTNVLIDFHRDGADENSSYEKFLSRVKTVEINGKTAATCTLVVGDKNDNSHKLKENAGKLHEKANQIYPGLLREIIVREGGYFNQYLSDYAFLIEVGTTLNTYEEVQYTADLLSEILFEYISEINK